MTWLPGRKVIIMLALLLLVGALLAACAGAGEALPTLAPSAEPPPTPVPPEPTRPPPNILAVPAGDPGSAALSLSAGGSSSQVIIQGGAPGAAIPPEVQRLLDELASGQILLNASPAGPDGEAVNYAYRDINGDGTRDLVVIVVAEPTVQGDAPEAEPGAEPVQTIGIDLDALVQSISENPDAPVVGSAFVYTMSPEELEQLDQQ